MRAFIVDDSMFVVTQLSQILRKGGWEVVGYAGDGEEALARLAATGPVDLVTLDITMPKLNGVETLRRLREVQPTAKCVIISAIGKKETVLETRALGVDGYIVKPLTTEKVLHRLREFVGAPV